MIQLEYQYELFEPTPTDFEIVVEDQREIKLSLDKLRRSFFARHCEMGKMICDLMSDINNLKNEIEKLKNPSKEGYQTTKKEAP